MKTLRRYFLVMKPDIQEVNDDIYSRDSFITLGDLLHEQN